MQLLIANQDHLDMLRGDIITVMPDTHLWSAVEVMSIWLASDLVGIERGLPERFRAPFIRLTSNFPHPYFAVARFPSVRCDRHLRAPQLRPRAGSDGYDRIRPHLWFLDLDALPRGQASSLEQPGGEGTLGTNRLSAIKERTSGTSITDAPDWDSDLTRGDEKHWHPYTNPINWLG